MVQPKIKRSRGGALNRFKINKLLEDYQELHSDFQIDNFIIGNQGDSWAQYKQCLREMKSRVESIESDKMQAEILERKPKQSKIFWPSKSNLEKRRVEKISNRTRLNTIYAMIKERERELSRFLEHAQRLKDEIGTIDQDRRYQLEIESWTAKGRKLAAIDLLSYGRISTQTLDFILSLPADVTEKILMEHNVKLPKQISA